MKTIWHVYIDESGRKALAGYVGNVDLPLADSFASMKLFESRKGAERYANSLAREIKKFLAMYGTPKIFKLEAWGGGQFDLRINVYSKPNSKKPVKSVWIKAVARDLRK